MDRWCGGELLMHEVVGDKMDVTKARRVEAAVTG